MAGFYCFTQPTPVVEPTIKEKIATLSSQQKTDILNHFIMAKPAAHVATELKLPLEFVNYLFELIDNMQATARAYMRGEVVITPAVLDGDGNITTPAVMNTPPATQTALGTTIAPLFDDFTAGQVTAIVSAMMKWSKFDGTGTFAFYKSQIIL